MNASGHRLLFVIIVPRKARGGAERHGELWAFFAGHPRALSRCHQACGTPSPTLKNTACAPPYTF